MSGPVVDAALMAVLQGDTGAGSLAVLAPGGVFSNIAPQGAADRGVFVIVQLQAHEDVYGNGPAGDEIAYQVGTFLVKAVARDSNGAGAVAAAAGVAAARIHTLLQGAALTISGFHWMDTKRVSRVSYTEQDGPVYWKHEGGLYVVEADAV